MVGLIVRFTLRQDAIDGFDHLVAATVAEIRSHEPGTLLYLVHHVAGAPYQRIFYELYASAAAFAAHEAQPHIRRFLEERPAYLAADVDVDRVEPVAALSVLARG